VTSAAVVEKAQRLLATGRVNVVSVDADMLVPEVEGDHARYRVVVIHGGPICSCPARRLCAHAVAVALVAGARVGPAYRKMNPLVGVKGRCQTSRRSALSATKLRVIPDVVQKDTATRPEEVNMSTSLGITVDQTIAAVRKQWPEVELVKKKAYHRVALGKLTLGYTYIRGQRPAFEVVKPDGSGKYDYIAIKSKADLTKAINAIKAVEKRAAKKATAAAKKAS
jgi:hypothetical protein